MIEFEFNLTKALQTMAFFAHHIPGIEKVKITKLLYLADKEHFLRQGWPVTGDSQYAMPLGPVPSQCLNALDGELAGDPTAAFKFLQIVDNRVLIKADPGTAQLAETELNVIRDILRQHGQKNAWDLVDETHQLPEYREVFVPRTSTHIPYELMLKHSGDSRCFRLGRPVISQEMRQHMVCPFPA
jgi:hypothetical protein